MRLIEEDGRWRAEKVCRVVMIALLISMTATAQDFKKVIQVVGELEDSVNTHLRLEQEQRRQEAARLRSDLIQMQQLLEDTRRQIAAHDSAATKAAAKPPSPAPAPPSFPTIKVGALVQVQGTGIQEKTTAAQDLDPNYTAHWARQIQLRRIRILAGGNLTANTLFFFESDSPLLGEVTGNGTKAVKMSMFVQDAYIQHTFAPELSLIAGLQLIGITRNGIQSAATLMPANYGTYTFTCSTPADNFVGRDIGLTARGFLADERLEYRAGMYSGRNVNLYTPFRFTVRVNYNFLDREKGFFYTGTTLGKGAMVAVGGGVDRQSSLLGYAVDGFADLPVLDLGSVTASASVAFYDGGGASADSSFFTQNVPKQVIFSAELGYFFKDLGLQPVVKYESQTIKEDVARQAGVGTADALNTWNSLKSGSRLGFGVNYFVNGHNFNVKTMYERVFRNRAGTNGKVEKVNTAELVVQIQYFTF